MEACRQIRPRHCGKWRRGKRQKRVCRLDLMRFRYLEMLGGRMNIARVCRTRLRGRCAAFPRRNDIHYDLSISLCTRSTSNLRSFRSSWSSEFKRSSPSIDLELNRATEDLTPSILFPACERGGVIFNLRTAVTHLCLCGRRNLLPRNFFELRPYLQI
jgi:hypothetical protein